MNTVIRRTSLSLRINVDIVIPWWWWKIMDGGATIIIVTLGGAMCGTSQCNMFGVYTTYWVRWAFFPHTQKTPENDLSRSRSQMIENDAELSVVKDTWVFVGVLEHNSWFIILLNGFCHPRPNSCWWWHQDSETHHIWHQNDDRRTETLNTAQKRVKRRGGWEFGLMSYPDVS